MKSFHEVFPTLEFGGPFEKLICEAYIERASAPSDMSFIKLYTVFNRLVDKETIEKLQDYMEEHIFPGKKTKILIEERFNLPDVYTPRNLFEAYKDRIYKEIKEASPMEYRLLRKSDIEFGDDSLSFLYESNNINRILAKSLTERLRNIFNIRCGLDCTVTGSAKEPQDHGECCQENDVYPDVFEYAEPVYVKKEEAFLKAEQSGLLFPEDADRPGGDSETGMGTGKPVVETKTSVKKKKSRGNGAGSPGSGRPDTAEASARKPKDPDVIYRKSFPDDFTAMKDIVGECGEVTVRGRVAHLNIRQLKKTELKLMTFIMTDFTDSIGVKLFLKEEELSDLNDEIKDGVFLKVRGMTSMDRFDRDIVIGSVTGIRKCEPFGQNIRRDEAGEKRVELHCHTKMSDMDAVSSVEDIIKRVKDWGMDAIAVTDHGNVQAYPDALHYVQKLKDKNAGKIPKIIYGVEAYLVDDLKDIVENPGERTLDDAFVVFDIETTGLSVQQDRIIEIGAVKVEGGRITDRYSAFVNPGIPIPYRIEELTGINDAMVKEALYIEAALAEFMAFIGDCPVVAHNAGFDTGIVRREAKRLGISWDPCIVDTVSLARLCLPQLSHFKLDQVARALGVELGKHHRAVDDAECTAHIFLKLTDMLKGRDVFCLKDIMDMVRNNPDMIRKMPTYHVIILVKNETGRVNLYRLISYSHVQYFAKRPRIPKSLLSQYREGLIIGSACEAGELCSAIVRGADEGEIERLVDFYDYLEIQPVGNNMFMIFDDKFPAKSVEDLQDINRQIVRLGEKYIKPVCATCDVHFLDPEDEIYRRIIFYGMDYEDADRQPPLYLRTTEEMLSEFSYLGPDKAYEVVVTNTRMISDSVDEISPVRPDKCPPVIENSDVMLKESCYRKAHEQYGEELPEIVEQRLEKELSSIISNGFAVMYIIAKKLVEKSNSDGYLVGSRGSVGSSFAAYTSGITEVNPLPPHYYCTQCKYSEFDSEDTRPYAGGAGCDMPDKICPVCGAKLKKDGFDIPFETFLGFNGDKEPDIDLNFSGEYQSKAHAYTEVIFGKGQTFRAGTVGTLADKTAFGYVKNYFEEHGQPKRKCEIDRLVSGCVGVKRTTGQHPGGIIVLPKGEEIYSFTPVQKPANDMSKEALTTHFDYHAIDHNLLKLDILGHQAPTMIRMLQDLTGIDPVKDIPLDSKETMSLFKGTEVLGLKPEDIGGTRLGSLGIPEFGTDFAIQMLIDAQPKAFSDLVRIAGLAHGTDVWIGNAHDLITQGTATIQTAICTRDDIMIYLISKNMDKGKSFKIMESVRKGKGLKEEWEQDMRDHDVPDWYIDSCKKIQYMFPKAHAAAYVMMSWRLAYCKIFYPLAFYAAYYSIMASGFDYELMCLGRERLEYNMEQLRTKEADKTISQKEEDVLRDMKIVQEMYARGFEFLPIDLYRSNAKHFTIEDGKLRPSFMSINGLGESAAISIEEAAKSGEFVSKEDFRTRAKVGKTMCDTLDSLGILGKVPESDQISIFDIL